MSALEPSRYTLELIGFRPYGFLTMEQKGAARAEAEASLCRLIPDLAPRPPNGVHLLCLNAHPETSAPWPGSYWSYGTGIGACYWKATIRA